MKNQLWPYTGRAQHRKMVLTCRRNNWRAQYKDSGGYPSSPCPEVTQLSLSLPHVSGMSRVAVPLSEPKVSACEHASLCVGPLGAIVCSVGIPTDFHNQIL